MSIKLYSLIFVSFFLLTSCSDSFNEPILLEDQKALSIIYKNKPLYSRFYYEGKATHNTMTSHVFVMQVLSKFSSFKHYNIYYLPTTQIDILSEVAPFTDNDSLKLSHSFSYVQNDGVFKLTHRKQLVESIQANFTEQYTEYEEKCINAIKTATELPTSYQWTKYAAEICFYAENYEASKKFTQHINNNIEHFDRYTTHGQMRHDYHTLMGRLDLNKGHVESAKDHLLHSVNVEPSAEMMSFGPNMELAADLLHIGEQAIILRYLVACEQFWDSDEIHSYQQQIAANKNPWRRESRSQKTTEPDCYYYHHHKLYKKALEKCIVEANAGLAHAQFNLAQLYRTGDAGIQDINQAFTNYKLAAEQNYPEAQFSLGIMYFQGAGTNVDWDKAKYWWSEAEKNGIASHRVQDALNRIPQLQK